MRPNLTPRATIALSTAGVSLFMLLCFSGYGSREALSAMPPAGWSDAIAAFFIRPLGAGAHVIAALGLVWGVIVYFQEQTPDLVLRMVGVTALAASTAMIVGLAKGGHDSVWAGTVGTAVARELVSAGTFGSVLGWLVFPALFLVSLFFATDWLFHSLRRGARPAFDPRTMPTEPSRGDLLETPADAEPREFVPAPSRAAECVEVIEVQAAKPVEVLPETLPKGFSATPTSEFGGRTVVRGPSGYEGVEFLPSSDELALPVADDGPLAHAAGEQEMVQAYAYDLEFFDAPLEGGEIAAAAPEPVAAPAPVAAVPAPAAEPTSGIGLADESLLIDEVFAMPASFDDAILPSDGASAAEEVRSSWATDEIAPSPATDLTSAEPLSGEIEAAPRPAHAAPRPAHAAPRFEAPAAARPRFEDEVMFGEATFEDEYLVFEEVSHEALAAESPMPDFAPRADVSEPSAASAVATMAPAATLAPAASAIAAPVVEAPAAATLAPEVADPVAVEPAVEASVVAATSPFDVVETDWAVDESLLASAPAAEIAAVDVAAVAAPADAAAIEAAPAMEVVEAVAPMVEIETAAPVVIETPAAPAVEQPVAAVIETPVAAPAPAAPETAQLALFPAPSFDASKLAGMDLDPLFSEAAKAILARGRASAVVLQRALGIGYARGLRILDQMTAAGMLGPDSPGGAREICFAEPPI